MQTNVLIAYTSNAGSTQEVAEAIADEIRSSGAATDVRRLEEVDDLSPYSAVIVGGPMIMGWHREAVKFLKKHRNTLAQIPVAYFMTAMSLTKTDDSEVNGVPVTVDAGLPKQPRNPARLSLAERYATIRRYVMPALQAAPHVKPVSVAIFGGKLEYFRLKFYQTLFVMLIVRAQPGDRRNWPVIRAWAAGLPAYFSPNI